MGYRVTSPYVTVQITGAPGAALTTLGFYKGAILPGNVDRESAELQVRKGMVERVTAEPVPAPVEADAEPVVQGGEPQASTKPARNASKVAWVTYAVSQRADGVDEADAKADAEALTHTQLVEKYGD